MIRGIVTSVIEGVIKRFSATGRSDETFENREFFQQYGYTSRPKPGAELIILAQGNNVIAVASDDRRYRISLEEGEVALYDDLGQVVHLKRDGIYISSPLKIDLTAPEIALTASTKITMDTPLVEVTGEITAGGDISDSAATAAKSMSGMRGAYNGHHHTHPADGVTIPAPTEQM